MYQKGIKRAIEVVLSLFGLILASWLYGLIILASLCMFLYNRRDQA